MPMRLPAPRLPRGFTGRLLAIAGAGCALRLLVVLVLLPDLRGRGDSEFFHALGNLLADGKGFVDPLSFVLAGEPEPTALHPPLFPLVLGAVARLGVNGYLAHRVVVVLIGTASLVALGYLGRRLAGDRAGLIAAGLGAVYPVLVSADGAVMSETPFGLLVLLALIAAYRLRERPTAATALALGALIGLAALTRGEGLLLLALLALPAALAASPGRLWRVALACAACLLVLLPWSIRNWAVFDRPVPLSNNSGIVLAGANCDTTYSGRGIGSWDFDCVPDPGGNEAEAAASNRARGLEYAADHAGRLPLVLPVRVLRSFGLYQPFLLADNAEARDPLLERLGTVAFWLLLPLAVFGATVLRRRRVSLMALAPVGVVVLASLAGSGLPRYRHPADLVAVVLAAVAVDALLSRRLSRRAAPPVSARPAPAR